MSRARANSSSEKRSSAGELVPANPAKGRAPTSRRRFAIAALLGATAAASLALFHPRSASAELENSIFTSKTDGLRLVVPRGWRATDQPSYPGLLLWMMRSEPEGRIVLTSEPFTRDVYCSWPVRCQMSHDALPAKLACALGAKLTAKRLRVGPVQAGPKENEDAGLPSVWFEYDDGHQFLRQAVAIDETHVVSLVLSAPSAEARNAQVRAFEQALRTLRPLTAEEMGTTGSSTGVSGPVAPGPTVTGSAASGSAASGSASGASTMTGSAASSAAATGSAASGSAMTSAASGSAVAVASAVGSGAAGSATPPAAAGSAMFSSAPAPRIEPIGACPRK